MSPNVEVVCVLTDLYDITYLDVMTFTVTFALLRVVVEGAISKDNPQRQRTSDDGQDWRPSFSA